MLWSLSRIFCPRNIRRQVIVIRVAWHRVARLFLGYSSSSGWRTSRKLRKIGMKTWSSVRRCKHRRQGICSWEVTWTRKSRRRGTKVWRTKTKTRKVGSSSRNCILLSFVRRSCQRDRSVMSFRHRNKTRTRRAKERKLKECSVWSRFTVFVYYKSIEEMLSPLHNEMNRAIN